MLNFRGFICCTSSFNARTIGGPERMRRVPVTKLTSGHHLHTCINWPIKCSPLAILTPTCGQRVQEKGPDSFDIDMVNTFFVYIFLAKGKLAWLASCLRIEIFSEASVDSMSDNSMMSSFVRKGYFTKASAILIQMGEKLSQLI